MYIYTFYNQIEKIHSIFMLESNFHFGVFGNVDLDKMN